MLPKEKVIEMKLMKEWECGNEGLRVLFKSGLCNMAFPLYRREKYNYY